MKSKDRNAFDHADEAQLTWKRKEYLRELERLFEKDEAEGLREMERIGNALGVMESSGDWESAISE